jgi:hypothetical protein
MAILGLKMTIFGVVNGVFFPVDFGIISFQTGCSWRSTNSSFCWISWASYRVGWNRGAQGCPWGYPGVARNNGADDPKMTKNWLLTGENDDEWEWLNNHDCPSWPASVESLFCRGSWAAKCWPYFPSTAAPMIPRVQSWLTWFWGHTPFLSFFLYPTRKYPLA